ncbi:hypothetical protein ACHAWC_011310, partial [Mediolabrus comicus]
MKHRLLLPSSFAKRISAQTFTNSGGVGTRRRRIAIGRQHSSQSHKSFSTTTNTTKPPSSETALFDRSIKLKQRTRAAENCRQHYINLQLQQQQSSSSPSTTSNKNDEQPALLPYDYFHREVAQRLVDRLDDINIRENGEGGFPLALEIGAGAGFVHEAIVDNNNGCGINDDELILDEDNNEIQYTGRGGVRKLVQLDSCSAMLHRNDDYIIPSTPPQSSSSICETYKLVTDEEGPFPFPDGTFDLVISSMAFHWINDLPRLLTEIKRVLKPNGCLLFALPGGNTLPELRSCLVLAELERTGGVSTHLGPYIDLSNVGSLLTGTGFKLPTIDVDDIQIGYPNMMVLMEHLGRMGEGNACLNRKDRVGLGTFV